MQFLFAAFPVPKMAGRDVISILRRLLDSPKVENKTKIQIMRAFPRIILSLRDTSRKLMIGVLLRAGMFDPFTADVLAGLGAGEIIGALAAVPDRKIREPTEYVILSVEGAKASVDIVDVESYLIQMMEHHNTTPRILFVKTYDRRRYVTDVEANTLLKDYPEDYWKDTTSAKARQKRGDKLWTEIPEVWKNDGQFVTIFFPGEGVLLSVLLDLVGDVDFAREFGLGGFMLDTIGQLNLKSGALVTRVHVHAHT